MISLNQEEDFPVQTSAYHPGGGTTGSISINNPAVQPNPLPEEVVKQRAEKYSFALGDKSPGVDQITLDISNGVEDVFRQQAAVQKEIELQNTKQKLLQEFASQQDTPLTPEDIAFFTKLSERELVDPQTVLENAYARKFATSVAARGDVVEQAKREDPEAVDQTFDVVESIISKKEIAQKHLEELEQQWENAGIVSNVLDYAKTFIPFWSNAHMMNELSGAQSSTSLLPGENILQQMEYLSLLSPEDFSREFGDAVREIARTSPVDAWNFANAYIQYSQSDAFIDTAFGAADVADVATAGIVGAARRSLTGLAKATVKAAGKRTVAVDSTLAAAGDIDSAAAVMARKRGLQKIREGFDPHGNIDELASSAPSLFNPKSILNDPGRLAREQADRIEANLDSARENLLESLTLTPGVRTTEEGLEIAFNEAQQRAKLEFRDLNNALLDIRHVLPDDSINNVASIDLDFGNTEGALFDTVSSALNHATDVYRFSEGDYQLVQQGNKWLIRVTRDVDETFDGVRRTLVRTEHAPRADLINTFLGALRSPDDILPAYVTEGRKTSTFVVQELQRLIKEGANPIMNMSKTEKESVGRILEINRYEKDPITGQEGNFYKTVGELERSYEKNLNRLPSESEVAAYFNFVQLSDLDWVVRNLSFNRDLARQGVREYQFEVPGLSTPTEWFKGKELDDIPWNDGHDGGVWFYDDSKKKGMYFRKEMADGARREQIRQLVQEKGYKVIQLAQPNERDFHKLNDVLPNRDQKGVAATINFLVVRAPKTKRLSWKLIPYRPGGHKVYQSNFMIKQANVEAVDDGKYVYKGDTPIVSINTEAEGKKFASRMEHARKLLVQRKEAEFDEYVTKNLPWTPEQFRGMFYEISRTEGTTPYLRLNSPITYTQNGESVADRLRNTSEDLNNIFPGLENRGEQPYNIYGQLNQKFHQERGQDVPSIAEGPQGVLNVAQPHLVDPMTTINRSVGNIIRMRAMEDTQIQSTEWWIENFADVLDVPLDELRRNPTYHLYNPVYKAGADRSKVAAARNTRLATVNFLGVKSPMQEYTDWAKRKLVDSIYNTAGQRASNYVSNKELFQTRDPAKYLRGIAFHTKLGLFNPVQLLLQAQSAAHAMAVTGNPARSMQALSGYYLMRSLAFTEDQGIINSIAKRATKLGWKREDFLESYDEMRKSGILNVEGEVAWRDDQLEPNIFQSKAGWFLDKGTFFFKEGERVGRMMAWNISYLEWKKANPGKRITARERASILRRASDLNVNMTRDSNAMWQQGVLSIPSQFMTYQVRLAEQFLGKRLTNAEKIRALAVYSALYGLPVAVGAPLGFAWPWHEDIKQAAFEAGVDTNDGAIDVLFNGAVNQILEGITGNEYNFGERYGPTGLSIFKEAFTGEKTAAEILLGASGSIGGDVFKTVNGALWSAIDVFTGEQSETLPILQSDLIDAARNISSINNTYNTIQALTFNKFITKNGMYLGDADPMDAFAAAIGLSPREISDGWIKLESMKELKTFQEDAKKEAIKWYRKGFQAESKEDQIAFFKKAKAILILSGMQPHQLSEAFREAAPQVLPFVDQVNRDWYRNAPADQVQPRLEQFINQGQQ